MNSYNSPNLNQNTAKVDAASWEMDAGLMRSVIDRSLEAVLVVNAENLVLLDANASASEMLGLLPEELVGRALSSIECSLIDVFFWEELRDEPEFIGIRSAQTEWMRSDGTLFSIEKRVSCFKEGDQCYWIIYAKDLTSQKELEVQQLQLVSQLQSSLESTAEGIVAINLSGQVVNMNRRFAMMWNLSEELLLEREENGMWQYILGNLIDTTGLLTHLELAQVEPQLETEELLALKDGRFFICVSKPEFLRDLLIGRVFSIRDITAMKRIESDLRAARDVADKVIQEKSSMLDALKVSESRIRRLVNSNLIGIMQGTNSGSIDEANDVILSMIGLSREDFQSEGLDWFKLTPPSHHQAYESAIKELRKQGQATPFEVELMNKKGDLLPVMVGLAQLEGSSTEWVGFVLDLTKQREADRMKADFISLVSHELRTPLTSIHGTLGLLENGICGEIPESAMKLVKIASKNSKRLGVLVSDLLDMEKLVSGKMTFKKERLDLVSLAEQAIEVNAGYAQALNVKYRLHDCPDFAWCYSDNNRLMQVFANLMSNAAKFSKEGDFIEISIKQEEEQFRVEVTDHGEGIPFEFRERIFKKFAQADHGDTRRQGGFGLGLNITQSLVEKMGGQIGYDSEIGVGTTFWFTVEVAGETEIQQ